MDSHTTENIEQVDSPASCTTSTNEIQVEKLPIIDSQTKHLISSSSKTKVKFQTIETDSELFSKILSSTPEQLLASLGIKLRRTNIPSTNESTDSKPKMKDKTSTISTPNIPNVDAASNEVLKPVSGSSVSGSSVSLSSSTSVEKLNTHIEISTTVTTNTTPSESTPHDNKEGIITSTESSSTVIMIDTSSSEGSVSAIPSSIPVVEPVMHCAPTKISTSLVPLLTTPTSNTSPTVPSITSLPPIIINRINPDILKEKERIKAEKKAQWEAKQKQSLATQMSSTNIAATDISEESTNRILDKEERLRLRYQIHNEKRAKNNPKLVAQLAKLDRKLERKKIQKNKENSDEITNIQITLKEQSKQPAINKPNRSSSIVPKPKQVSPFRVPTFRELWKAERTKMWEDKRKLPQLSTVTGITDKPPNQESVVTKIVVDATTGTEQENNSTSNAADESLSPNTIALVFIKQVHLYRYH